MYGTPLGSVFSTADSGFTRRLGGFEVEQTPSRAAMRLPGSPEQRPQEEEEIDLPTAVGRLLAAKAQPFAVGGRIPLDPADLTLFFRTQSNAAHFLSFPIDVEDDDPPALDVLIAACRPSIEPYMVAGGPPPLAYPAYLPFSTTLELANRPILAALQSVLLPSLPPGQYVTAVRERLDVLITGARSPPTPATAAAPGRVATMLVTLPARFRGGDVVVTAPVGGTERFHHSKRGQTNHLEWVAWTEGCAPEIEQIRKGCRIDVRYGVYVQTFGPTGATPDPLIAPAEEFRARLGAVLNLTRNRRVGFYLSRAHGVNPAESIADSLVPMLSGGDSLLYHTLRSFDLAPELRWTAGGYLWPADHIVDIALEPPQLGSGFASGRRTPNAAAFAYGMPAGGPGAPVDEADRMRVRVEASGAQPLAVSDIAVLADWDGEGLAGVGKERVPFVSAGQLERLVVHVLLVVHVA